MAEAPDRTTEPGKALEEYAASLQRYLVDLAGDTEAVAERMEALGRESGGINGLSTWARSTASKLRDEAKAMRDRAESYHASLTTAKAPPEITEATDEDHLERVKEARETVPA